MQPRFDIGNILFIKKKYAKQGLSLLEITDCAGGYYWYIYHPITQSGTKAKGNKNVVIDAKYSIDCIDEQYRKAKDEEIVKYRKRHYLYDVENVFPTIIAKPKEDWEVLGTTPIIALKNLFGGSNWSKRESNIYVPLDEKGKEIFGRMYRVSCLGEA